MTIFEKAAHVGGLWNNHPSAIYAHLRANTPAPIMQLEGRQQQEPDDSSYLPCQVGQTGQNISRDRIGPIRPKGLPCQVKLA